MADATLRRSRRTNDPEGTRRRVLDAAALAFQSEGYRATSVHDLQRGAGVSGGALHHHFATKKALALAVISERVVRDVRETWVGPMASASSAAAGIAGVFETVIGGLEERGSVAGCPLGNMALELSLTDEDLRREISSGYREWRTAIEARLQDDMHAGRAAYAAGDAQSFSELVVAIFSGALVVAKAEQSTRSLRACDAHLRLVMAKDLTT